MNKKTWDLYAPIYKRAVKTDQKIYDAMKVVDEGGRRGFLIHLRG